jgi:hypothetical protein
MNRFTREVIYGNFNHLKGKVSSSMADHKINHDYVENYSEVFAETVVSNFFQSKDTINGKEIVNLTPSKQVNFLVLKSLYTQWQSEMKKLESPYFDFNNEKVRGALMKFMNTVSQHINVSKEHFQPVLKDAMEDAIYLVFAPYDFFLADISLRNQNRISVKNLKSIGKYLKVNKDVFDLFISKLEEQEEDKLPTDTILQVLNEVFEEFRSSTDTGAFIEEISSTLHFNIEEFLIVEDSDSLAEEQEVIDEPQELDPVEEEIVSDEVSYQEEENIEEEVLPEDNVVESELDDLDDEVGDVDDIEEMEDIQAIAEDVKELRDPPPSDEDNSINSQYSQENTTLNDRLQTSDEVSIADHHTNSKVDSVLSSISVNQRYMFINELFEGDNEEFLVAFDKIEECKSFDDSVELLVNGYAKKYGWDMGSDNVKELLKTVFRKFR